MEEECGVDDWEDERRNNLTSLRMGRRFFFLFLVGGIGICWDCSWGCSCLGGGGGKRGGGKEVGPVDGRRWILWEDDPVKTGGGGGKDEFCTCLLNGFVLVLTSSRL